MISTKGLWNNEENLFVSGFCSFFYMEPEFKKSHGTIQYDDLDVEEAQKACGKSR